MKKCLTLVFLIVFGACVGQCLYYAKDGFTIRRIHTLTNLIREDFSPEAKQALNQPFRYLGRGRQCFAFESEDGKYVLKFPRTDIYKTPLWAKALPVSRYRQKLEKTHKAREAFILDSFRISFHELKEQTGLLALHLGQSPPSSQSLRVIDALGCSHHLKLWATPFALQIKRPILMQEFIKALKAKKEEKAKQILDALLIVIKERAEKGILNRDRSFLRNYGFDGEKAYQIDVGSFFKRPDLEPAARYEKSLRDSIDPIQEWLSQNSPEMLSYLNEQLQELL